MEIQQALAFDDVLLVLAASDVLPSDADTRTRLTRRVNLAIPLVSAAMDTVTESSLAIAMAEAGGLGIVHKNMSPEQQAAEVRRVKKYEFGMVVDPMTIGPDASLADALALMSAHKFSGVPVVEDGTGRLLGILTNRDVRFADNVLQPVSELMTRDTSDKPLVTARLGVDRGEAKRLLHKHRIEKLLVVDDDYRCIGLITVKDIEKAERTPNACKDEHGRLRVGAATGVGEAGFARAELLLEADVDVVVVDTAHGHSQGVIEVLGASDQAAQQLRAGDRRQYCHPRRRRKR